MAKRRTRPSMSRRRTRRINLPRLPWSRLLGLALWLVALGTLLALLSPNRSPASELWIALLRRAFGWGRLFVPLIVALAGYRALAQEAGRQAPWAWHRWSGLALALGALLALAYLLVGREAGGLAGQLLAQPLLPPLGRGGVVALYLLLVGVGTVLAVQRLPLPNLAPLFGFGRRIRLPRLRLNLPPLFGPRRPQTEPFLEPQPGAAAKAKPELAPEPAPETEEPLVQGGWTLPRWEEVLDPLPPRAEEADLQVKSHIIEDTLHAFGVPARVVRIQQGPVVTLFGVEPGYTEVRGKQRKVRVGKITTLQNDLALALSASRLRMQAPVPGYPYVGVEVPNESAALVSLRGVMESEAFRGHPSTLKLALGMDVSGKAVVGDLVAMPHLLIAGATGSGKSVCINSLICALLLQHSPQSLNLLLVDPKRVELVPYNGVPHLLGSVITNPAQTARALLWVSQEIDRRLGKLAEIGARNLGSYNRKAAEPLPYLVIVIDELADLMLTAPEETERLVTRIAQIARATGIHLVMATQRPSVDVVTGLIKANFPARLAFTVVSQIDSRVILDQPGAERLLGRGDMLFLPPDAGHPVRLQGAYISDAELTRVARYWRDQGIGRSSRIPPWLRFAAQVEDELLPQAIQLAAEHKSLSAVSLGRLLGVGTGRAQRLLEALEERGVLMPSLDDGGSRRVLEETSGE